MIRQRRYPRHMLSSYNLPFGVYWTTYHHESLNSPRRDDFMAKWFRSEFGEHEPVDPAEWRNYLAGDRHPYILPGGHDPLGHKYAFTVDVNSPSAEVGSEEEW